MTIEQLPGHQEQPEEIICHNCGRFVGPLNKCPNCGARIEKRMSVRFFRMGAILVGLVGLGLLWMMAARSEVPIIEIGGIERTMNFAFVRIAGTVMGEPRITREAGRVASVSITVDDGTGEIAIRAYRAKAQELIEKDRLPRSGDKVIVGGSLQVSADDMAMWLADTDLIQIVRKDLMYPAVADLTLEDESRIAVVRGIILDVAPPKVGTRMPWSVRFTDGSGIATLNMFEDTYQEIPDKMRLEPGSVFEATLILTIYQDKLQLQLNRGSDFAFLDVDPSEIVAKHPGAPTEPHKISMLTEEQDGHMLMVKGRITALDYPPPRSRAYHRITIKEGRHEITIVYQAPHDLPLRDERLVVGAEVRVTARMEQLTRERRLRIYHPSQIEVL